MERGPHPVMIKPPENTWPELPPFTIDNLPYTNVFGQFFIELARHPLQVYHYTMAKAKSLHPLGNVVIQHPAGAAFAGDAGDALIGC
eukprot:scaffold477650_cov18-Prasinocladus_malaysianus.AAC.1